MSTLSQIASPGSYVSAEQARELIAQACPAKDYKDKKVLLIVPDATRTCPLGILFTGLFDQIGGATKHFDVMIALGTHSLQDSIMLNLHASPAWRDARFGVAPWWPTRVRVLATARKECLGQALARYGPRRHAVTPFARVLSTGQSGAVLFG